MAQRSITWSAVLAVVGSIAVHLLMTANAATTAEEDSAGWHNNDGRRAAQWDDGTTTTTDVELLTTAQEQDGTTTTSAAGDQAVTDGVPSSSTVTATITEEDLAFAEAASRSVQAWCSDASQGGGMLGTIFGIQLGASPFDFNSVVSARWWLTFGVGERNIVVDLLNSSSTDGMQETATERAQRVDAANRLMFMLMPMVLGALLLPLWWCCCCAACCNCCRFSASKCKVRVANIIMAAMILCTWACIAMIVLAWFDLRDGIDAFACSWASLVHAVFSGYDGGGHGSPSFVGIVPMLTSLNELEHRVSGDSEFVRGIQSILNQTADINTAVSIASETLSLLKAMMEESDNLQPKDVTGASLFHQNLLAAQSTPYLTSAIQAFDAGMGTALASARAQVETQFSPAKRQDLQGMFSSSSAPLAAFKDMMRDSLRLVLPSDPGGDMWAYRSEALLGCVLVLAMYALLNTFFAACSAYRGMKKVAGCSWCCGCWLSMLCFISGGVMLVVAVLLSGTCLMLEETHSQTLQDVASGMNLSGAGESTVAMAADVFSSCFNPSGDASQASLGDIFYARDENNAKVNLRQVLQPAWKADLDAEFARINNGLPTIAANQQVQALQTLLRDNPADKLIVADYEAIRVETDYSSLINAMNSSAAAIGFTSSAACGDHTFTGQLIPGIADFMVELEGLGDGTSTAADAPSCASHVGCAGVDHQDACNAGNNLITLKAALQGLNGHKPYKCSLFRDAAGNDCDPGNMLELAATSPSQYAGDCVSTDGTLVRKARTCNLADFTAYMGAFDGRIGVTLQRVDDTTASVQDEIGGSLRNMMYEDFFDNLTSVADKLSCGHLATTYDATWDAFCYQALSGWWRISVSYTALAATQLVLALSMYAVWQCTRDVERAVKEEEEGFSSLDDDARKKKTEIWGRKADDPASPLAKVEIPERLRVSGFSMMLWAFNGEYVLEGGEGDDGGDGVISPSPSAGPKVLRHSGSAVSVVGRVTSLSPKDAPKVWRRSADVMCGIFKSAQSWIAFSTDHECWVLQSDEGHCFQSGLRSATPVGQWEGPGAKLLVEANDDADGWFGV